MGKCNFHCSNGVSPGSNWSNLNVSWSTYVESNDYYPFYHSSCSLPSTVHLNIKYLLRTDNMPGKIINTRGEIPRDTYIEYPAFVELAFIQSAFSSVTGIPKGSMGSTP